jgi:ubiquinone/menaquinone biosynthesis C-methylase UbiE
MENQSFEQFYSISDAEAQQTYVGVRRANEWVGFFLPHLKPGFTVLDCGCGVGSITLDIAELVAPGQVIGIDMDEGQLEVARANAKERGLTNVSFEQANVYALRFADSSFDAVLAHTLLVHLDDPLRALREFKRLLKPGGVVGISDDDLDTIVFSPENPFLRKFIKLFIQMMHYNGGDPFYSRHLRSLLLEAGFSKTEGHAVAADHYGRLEETRRLATVLEDIFRSPDAVALITRQEWASQAELIEMIDEIKQWAERPDAFFAWMYCAAVGWV